MISRPIARALSAGILLGAVIASPSYAKPMAPLGEQAIDVEHDCLEPVPESVSVTGVSDDGENIDLQTMVLLDGVSKKLGKRIMTLAQETYDPLAITIVPQYKKVAFPHGGIEMGMDNQPGPTGDTSVLIDDSKAALGGSRPEGIDLVLLLTDKDLYYTDGAERNYGVAGMADCIGGIRFDDHGFAVSEGISPHSQIIESDTFVGLAAAHELAHLLGAHHHYGNCGQGEESGKPCTIMFPFRLEFISANLGALEAATVRGHAVAHASR